MWAQKAKEKFFQSGFLLGLERRLERGWGSLQKNLELFDDPVDEVPRCGRVLDRRVRGGLGGGDLFNGPLFEFARARVQRIHGEVTRDALDGVSRDAQVSEPPVVSLLDA